MRRDAALCQQALHHQQGPHRAWFGYSDEAFAVGLTCSGELDLLVQRIDPANWPHLAAALTDSAEGRATALARVVASPAHLLGGYLALDREGRLSGTDLGADTRRMVAAQAQALLRACRTTAALSAATPRPAPNR